MEDIRCPMCSKMNPAENEECEFCGARLTPLVTPPEDSTPEPASEADDNAIPEWLDRLGSLIDSQPGPDSAAKIEKKDDIEAGEIDPGDWLARLQGETRQLNPDVIPDLTPEPPDEPASEPSAAGDEDIPEWLRNVRDIANRETSAPPLGVPVINPSTEGEPDWLERLRNQKLDEDNAPASEPPAPPVGTPPAEEPAWLHAFPAQPETPPAETSFPSLESTPQLPEWLSGGNLTPSSEPLSEWNPASEPAEQADIPDWLGSEAQAQPPAAEKESGYKPAFTEDVNIEDRFGGKPDWLVELEARAQGGVSKPQQGPTLSFDEPITAGSAPQDPNAFAGEELPDWLASFGPAAPQASAPEVPQPPAPPEPRQGEDLAPADLPSWLRAMRPIETVAPSAVVRKESDQREEKTGPLAGLRGTLPAEPSLGGFQRPPSYIARLQPTESQERYKAIVEQLIANEKEPQPTRAASLISPQRLIRLAIALVLLAAVLFPFVTGLSVLPAPGLFPQETLDIYDAINALPDDAAVLVAIEYAPALAGEMQSAAAGVLDHLMQKGARLAYMSTSPTGLALEPLLMQAAFAQPADYQSAYVSGEKIAMLGYLAGGPAGLMDFALRPQVALPASLPGGGTAWQQPVLQGVSSLAGFDMILLITDDQDSGKTWLEQIQPAAPTSTPLLLVSSAQAAPVLSAYLDGRQVDGMVTGLTGGTIYNTLLQKDAGTGAGWQAYELAMAASLAIILVGTAADLLTAYFKSRKGKGGEQP